MEYETSGFLGLQLVIDNEFIKLVADANPGSKFKEPYWYTEAIAYPKYHRLEKSHYTMVLGTLLPAAIILGFVYMISISIQIVVEERVTGKFNKTPKSLSITTLSREVMFYSIS